KIAYQNRYHRRGFVYIAGSLQHRLIKIGTAVDCRQREENLRRQRYGGISDWTILFYVEVENAGKLEQAALQAMHHSRFVRRFDKDGFQVDAGEILDCSFTEAINAIGRLVTVRPVSGPWMSEDHPRYDFKPRD